MSKKKKEKWADIRKKKQSRVREKEFKIDKELSEKDFKCNSCGGVFEKGRSDEDAMAEANEIFSKEEMEDEEGLSIICDDCHKTFMKRFKKFKEN